MNTSFEKLVFYTYLTPYGRITIQGDGNNITKLALTNHNFNGEMRSDALLNECATQINEYLAGKRYEFSIPISTNGSSFQESVWRAIMTIPYGQTRCASELATLAGHPNSARSVGRAIRENPIAILIPAHRVTSTTQTANNKLDKVRAQLRQLEQKYS